MSYYNSDNTTILATHDQKHLNETNTRMLLLHKCENGRREFVIGSYFTQTTEVSSCQEYERTDYSWDWGHYFEKFESAASYWFEEVLGKHIGEER